MGNWALEIVENLGSNGLKNRKSEYTIEASRSTALSGHMAASGARVLMQGWNKALEKRCVERDCFSVATAAA